MPSIHPHRSLLMATPYTNDTNFTFCYQYEGDAGYRGYLNVRPSFFYPTASGPTKYVHRTENLHPYFIDNYFANFSAAQGFPKIG